MARPASPSAVSSDWQPSTQPHIGSAGERDAKHASPLSSLYDAPRHPQGTRDIGSPRTASCVSQLHQPLRSHPGTPTQLSHHTSNAASLAEPSPSIDSSSRRSSVTFVEDNPEYPQTSKSEATKIALIEVHGKSPRLPEDDASEILEKAGPYDLLTYEELRRTTSYEAITVNIYSHILGFLLFATFPAYIYTAITPRFSNAQVGDYVVFALYFAGVAICFFLSALYHTVANHSKTVAAFWVQFDFVGIVVLMWGATVATVYYGFWCDPTLRWVYWGIVSGLSCLCIGTTTIPVFQTPAFRPYRAAMFALLGISSVVFIAHGIRLHGWHTQLHRMSLGWMGLMALLNLIGAAAYAARVPERWTRGRTDVWGHGHQWLHIFVVLAGIAHAVGLVAAFDYVHGPGGGGMCDAAQRATSEALTGILAGLVGTTDTPA